MFSTFDLYTNILDLEEFKCELKSVNVTEFAKQVSSIQKVTEIIRELEHNQALVEVTELLHLIRTIPATYASFERSSSLNYRCSQSEERLSTLVFISMKKMKA